MDRTALGDKVRTLRQQRKWTLKDLAARAHVTENTLRGLERGTVTTRWPKLELVARALDTTAERLIRLDDDITQDHPLLKGLNEEDLEIARQFHDALTDRRVAVRRLLNRKADGAIVILDGFFQLDQVGQALMLAALDQFLGQRRAAAKDEHLEKQS